MTRNSSWNNALRRVLPIACAFVLAGALGACTSLQARQAAVHSAGSSLRFIGEQRLAWRQPFQGTTVGGLSGIDYDPVSGVWVLESDDRSEINPARYYTARLDYDPHTFRSVSLTGVHFFRQADGSTYPGLATLAPGNGEVPDVESIRFDPQDGSIWYASEGSRKLGLQPFVRHATADGAHLGTLPLPQLFKVWPGREDGVRDNLAIEGISFAPDGQSLWVSLESPLYQDGPLPTSDAGAFTRITQLDRTGRVLAQFAYPVDPIPAGASPGRLSDNGVSEILAIDASHLYVLERAGVQSAEGDFHYIPRLYEIDLAGASDVSTFDALLGQAFLPVRKRLVLDISALPLAQIGNIEGIAWGPKLENGSDSLVMVADDNFKRSELGQLLLFEVKAK